MKVLKYIFFIVISLSFAQHDDLFITPKNWPKPVYNFTNNALTKSKVELGRVLFYDPILSKDNTISCASCHSPFSAFTHIDHALSHGIHDSIGARNSPALINLAWQKTFMWDGAINNLDMQALAPITHKAEMANDIKSLVQKLNTIKLYKHLFKDAFGDSIATGEKTLKAISQFLLTLISSNAKYDRVMKKQEIFTSQEINGYRLFQKHCNTCHKEPLFTTNDFANNGLSIDTLLNDYGRFIITKNPSDSLKFKIPTLRNIEFTFPYMHDGRFKKLSQVMTHYTSQIQSSKTLASELKQKITLTSNEKVDIIAFLITLSDREFVFDKRFADPYIKYN
ncbi:MAG: cytochrome-c peroxidase [Bacteroidia bacterium]|nr:cytochrome-c peroxidase [Bacteroidia bacterium]